MAWGKIVTLPEKIANRKKKIQVWCTFFVNVLYIFATYLLHRL